MSETCIVCLGELGESATGLPHSHAPALKSEDDDHATLGPNSLISTMRSADFEPELIAHLLPCAHNLHNECLKPWVERANSCPICRQSFNQVELSHVIGGPVVSSYPVSDRIQVADVDPSMLIEEEDYEEPEDQPCPICGHDDNEDVLLSCDGCEAFYHTYCVDLDGVPVGHWFCQTCDEQRAIESVCPPVARRPAPRPHNTVDRRTRGQQRRLRQHNQATSSSWARVWQSVWDNLNLDLDFPFDEGPDAIDRAQRAISERRDFQQWERRFQVAERQGGANRFRDTASALLDINPAREQREIPEPESREEILAWNAFEKAKEIDLDPSPKRKRKSATTSPSDADAVIQTERPLKRPRTRRTIDPNEASSSTAERVSPSRQSSAAGPSSSRILNTHHATASNNGPSFLQSMLKEIETSNAPDETGVSTHLPLSSATNHSSPNPSSPGPSPTNSSHATPRARSTTPPPSSTTRPGSPLSLTSKVEPIFPPPEFSASRSPPDTSLVHRKFNDTRQTIHDRRQSRPTAQSSSPPRSQDTSPTRLTIPLSTKTDLQKMVTAALKPHYHSSDISKDQYTDINRNVSRMLYDKVGGIANFDSEAKERWERLASEEVDKAVQSVKLAS